MLFAAHGRRTRPHCRMLGLPHGEETLPSPAADGLGKGFQSSAERDVSEVQPWTEHRVGCSWHPQRWVFPDPVAVISCPVFRKGRYLERSRPAGAVLFQNWNSDQGGHCENVKSTFATIPSTPSKYPRFRNAQHIAGLLRQTERLVALESCTSRFDWPSRPLLQRF